MKPIFLVLLIFGAQVSFGQKEIKGTIVDNTQNPLSGATVIINGNGSTKTDFHGHFTLTTDTRKGKLEIFYLGYRKKSIAFKDGKDAINLGQIILAPEKEILDEINLIGKGVIDLEEDRRTPTAVSTVGREQIQLRNAGNVEFPNILKNTPSAYISSESGGFGDAKLFVRGFDQSNTAFLLNGQPVNGMQNGQLYWSNWNGLTDIVNSVQVQRGLGSSKLAVSSVGGTINMITKATAKQQGGFLRFLGGNGSFFEGTAAYDTGLSENGWGFSFLVDYWQAHKKYAEGTRGQGQNYFFSLGKKVGDHNFNFLLTGAPLTHDQNPSKALSLYKRYGRRYNNQYGFRSGSYFPEKRKFYHKPIFNFNWDWTIDKRSNLSTVLYASFGHGGGTQIYGRQISQIKDPKTQDDPLLSGAYFPENGLIDWDFITNRANGKLHQEFSHDDEGTTLASTVNNNQYYGGVINYENNKVENLSFNIGADIRFYRDDHFKQLIDKLGLKGRTEEFGGRPGHKVTSTFKADPWAVLFNYAGKNERVDYDYSENINYQGGFGQAEWTNERFSAFLQGAVSNQSYKRVDRSNFEQTEVSETFNKMGYNLKAGASVRFTGDHILFANAGKFSRQPFLNNIFTSLRDRTKIDHDEVHNEEILTVEAGYRWEIKNLTVDLNAYYTDWRNRLLTTTGSYDPEGEVSNPEFTNVSYLFTNIAEVHQGLELEVQWQPIADMKVHGYGTIGKWEYDGKTPVKVRNEADQSLIEERTTELKNTKVGQAPQTAAGLGIDYAVVPSKLRTYINWNYYTDFYGFVDVDKAAKMTLENKTYQPKKLNSYSLVDLGLSYDLRFGKQRFRIAGNVYNLFNHSYISQKDNFGYYMGNGLTYNFFVKYLF